MSLSFGIVILAAGSSCQQGRPKQLLPYLGRTLIEHVTRTAIASGASEVVVVLGPNSQEIQPKLIGLPVRIVVNRDWHEGLSSSIRCGVGALGTDIQSAVIALGDQACVTPDLFRDLAQRQLETGAPIVASSYDGIVGAPSSFHRSMFPELMALNGIGGARELIRQSSILVETIEFSAGNVSVEETAPTCRIYSPAGVPIPRDVFQEPQDARAPPAYLKVWSFAA